MPIRVQNDLPVKEILEQENIFVMDELRAAHQDIRPISIGLLNLMPLKEDTELQILRALSNSPLQVDVTFVRVTSHVSKNTSTSHIYKFYEAFDDIKDKRFDGFIITGAPVEQMPFEEVDYWEKSSRIRLKLPRKRVLWAAPSLLFSATLLMTTHSWLVPSTVFQRLTL